MHTLALPSATIRPAPSGPGSPPDNTARPHPVPYSTSIRELPSEERPRERLLALGASSLTNSELIAILLRTGGRGESVLSLAVRLLSECSGLRGLLQASVAEICALKGVNEAKAAQVVAALELGRRAASVAPEERALVRTPEDIYNLVGAELAHLAQERLCVVLLSTKQEVLRVRHVYQGTVNSASVRIAEVLRPAIKENCPNFVVAHNHPSGDPTPSQDDIRITQRLVASAAIMDIDLQDHLVIGTRGFVSMKQHGLGFEPAGRAR